MTNPTTHRPFIETVTSKSFYLLLALVFLIFVYPFLAPYDTGNVVLLVLEMLVLILGLFWLGRPGMLLWVGVALVALRAVLDVIFLLGHDEALFLWGILLSCLIYLLVAVSLLRYVLGLGKVTADKLYACICAYVLIAVFWGQIYFIVYFFSPESFVIGESENVDFSVRLHFDFIYFSFTTITTTGFGEILPVSQYARSLVILEQLVGVMYVAFLIARLAGLYRSPDSPLS